MNLFLPLLLGIYIIIQQEEDYWIKGCKHILALRMYHQIGLTRCWVSVHLLGVLLNPQCQGSGLWHAGEGGREGMC